MGRIISRHLEELATPRISEWGGPFSAGGSQIGGRSKSRSAMLVVRGAMLAEWSNSGAGSGLRWKIETGGDKRWRRRVSEGELFFKRDIQSRGGEQAEENRKIRSTCFFWSRYDFFFFFLVCFASLVLNHSSVSSHLRFPLTFEARPHILFLCFKCFECRFIIAFDFWRLCLCSLLAPPIPSPIVIRGTGWGVRLNDSLYVYMCACSVAFSYFFVKCFFYVECCTLHLVIWAEALTGKLKSIP